MLFLHTLIFGALQTKPMVASFKWHLQLKRPKTWEMSKEQKKKKQGGSRCSGGSNVKTKVNKERHARWWRYPFSFPHHASPLFTPHLLPGLNKWQEMQAGQSCAD